LDNLDPAGKERSFARSSFIIPKSASELPHFQHPMYDFVKHLAFAGNKMFGGISGVDGSDHPRPGAQFFAGADYLTDSQRAQDWFFGCQQHVLNGRICPD
jgi:hypothetical protein